MKYTDSHCHIDFSDFDACRSQLLSQCYQQGIHRLVVPAVASNNWAQVLMLANNKNQTNNQAQCYAALGIHPWYVTHESEQSLEKLKKIVIENQSNIVAIGETGLDGAKAKHEHSGDIQLSFFKHQLLLANEMNLPLIVHHRQSHNEILHLFKQQKPLFGGIIHAFSGSYEQAMQYIELGFVLGIGGTITYERAKKTRNALKRIPLEYLVLETDAPSMPLNHFQGQTNSPLRTLNVFDCLVELVGVNQTELALQLEKNIERVLPL